MCTIEVPLAFLNDMLGDDAIESDEPTLTLGVLALINSKGAETQKIPGSRIDMRNLSKAVQNIYFIDENKKYNLVSSN